MQLSSQVQDSSPFERRVPSSSTLKGTLHKTPPRRRPPELQHTGLEPSTKLHGGVPPTHSEDAKTMIKSKRLEPCGRCQVMTAVRVALPCGRLVNLCIPCASTFARFLSKRIRDLARETCHSSGEKNRPEATGGEGRARSAGKSRSKDKRPRGKILEAYGGRGSPMDMANEQLQALDASSVSKAHGRGKGQIPDNAGGGLSPTFRARKASPQQRGAVNGPGNEAASRSQNVSRRDMQLSGSCASPMIVADPGLAPSPFGRTPSDEHLSQRRADSQLGKPNRSSQSSAAQHQYRDLESPSAWSAASTKTWVSRAGKQVGTNAGVGSAEAYLGAQLDPSSLTATREKRAQRSAAAASGGTNFSGGRLREPERERHVLPHGRTLIQTSLTDTKSPTYFPELRGARSDIQPQQLPRMYSDGNPAGGYLREAAGSNSWQQQQGALKESAVRRERGPGGRSATISASLHQAQHADGAVSVLDKFEKISPKSSRRNTDLVDSAKEIRRRMMEDLHGSGSPSPHTWSNGGDRKKTPGSMPLKFVLSSAIS